MRNFTKFNPQGRYIWIEIAVADVYEEKRNFLAILDTGAPTTEFSDEALEFLGYLDRKNSEVELKHGLQTQKYGKVVLPYLEICSHAIKNLEVYVSHFEKSWGIKALVGLDFFRRFCVTINYKVSQIVTEQFAA